MTQKIEFLYDFGSPNAFLMHKVLPDFAQRVGADLVYVPVLLGGIFKATQNQSPIQAFGGVKGKIDYLRVETTRFVQRHELQFNWNPNFPIMTIGVMRGAVFAQSKDWEQRYLDTVFDAMWVNGKKMDEPEVIAGVLDDAGLPAGEIMAATQTDDVKQGLIDNTSAAVARGAFGAPTMFVGDEMFFGKDSLPDLEWVIARAASEDA